MIKAKNQKMTYKFDSELINVMCSCEPNEKLLKRQALSHKSTVISGMPCPLGYDESHQLTCFLTPELKIPVDTDQNTTVGLLSNDQ